MAVSRTPPLYMYCAMEVPRDSCLPLLNPGPGAMNSPNARIHKSPWTAVRRLDPRGPTRDLCIGLERLRLTLRYHRTGFGDNHTATDRPDSLAKA